MIEYKQGNIFDSNEEAIVNTVNCVGVMGRGIALQFKKQYPDNFSFYESACKRDEVVPGRMLVHEMNSITNPRYIINFPTKRHWRGNSSLDDIRAGLVDLKKTIQEKNIKSIAIPPLGCGLGGLEWNAVKSHMEAVLTELLDVSISIYEPIGAPEAGRMARTTKTPKMTSGRAVLVSIIKRYLDGQLDPIVSLLEVHKLMYFMQESGEFLKLNYVKGNYGPYARNLSHVLNSVEGHLLYGYADGGDNPNKQIKIIPGADVDADAFLQQQPETLFHINQVTKLVDGFETPTGMELLSTVHWVVSNEIHTKEPKLDEVVDKTYAWGMQKRRFNQRQIKIAYERLEDFGWLSREDITHI